VIFGGWAKLKPKKNKSYREPEFQVKTRFSIPAFAGRQNPFGFSLELTAFGV